MPAPRKGCGFFLCAEKKLSIFLVFPLTRLSIQRILTCGEMMDLLINNLNNVEVGSRVLSRFLGCPYFCLAGGQAPPLGRPRALSPRRAIPATDGLKELSYEQ